MLQKIKKNVNIQAMISVIPAVLFVVFLFFMMVKTYTGEVKTVIEDTELSLAGFSSLSGTLEDVLQSNLYEKNSYINLNGLAARVLGINSLNVCSSSKNVSKRASKR